MCDCVHRGCGWLVAVLVVALQGEGARGVVRAYRLLQ